MNLLHFLVILPSILSPLTVRTLVYYKTGSVVNFFFEFVLGLETFLALFGFFLNLRLNCPWTLKTVLSSIWDNFCCFLDWTLSISGIRILFWFDLATFNENPRFFSFLSLLFVSLAGFLEASNWSLSNMSEALKRVWSVFESSSGSSLQFVKKFFSAFINFSESAVKIYCSGIVA